MKKYVISFLCLFLLVGCNNKNNITPIDIDFDNEYYQVYTPYKKGVGNNYVVNNVLNNYDILEVEKALMMVSSKYFKTNNSYYQEGQFLTEKELKLLLNKDNLNKAPNIEIGGINITPTYITSIYEQNYLATNGNLKGISLAIVLNPYQAYKNSYGIYSYKIVNEEELIAFGKTAANELFKYIRQKKELKDVRVLIGLYFQKSPNAVLPGIFKYVGISHKDTINLEEVDYQYYYLNSNYILEHDVNSANAYNNIEQVVKELFPVVNVIGIGLYEDSILKNIEIIVNNSHFKKSELLYLSQTLSEKIGTTFNNIINIKVLITANDKVLALIHKESNTSRCNVYMING
ncbi:MAG: hypothetical protein GX247_01060 [Mollicutes bacterium]|nr:hypothetical protein [Mollicutes bacterium]